MLVLARSKSELVRSMLVQELGSKQVLELARNKLVLVLDSKLVQELGSKLVLELARSKLELVLGSKKVLVRSKRSSPCGNRTNRLRS